MKGEFHLGDMVNCIRKGSLVMDNTQHSVASLNAVSSPSGSSTSSSSSMEDIVSGVKGELIFGTVSGSIGVIARITGKQYRFLLRLQNAIAQVIPRLGKLSYREWRSLQNERRPVSNVSKPINFIDGDMIERFLDLDKPTMEKVASLVNQTITVASGVAQNAGGDVMGSSSTSAVSQSKDIDMKSSDAPSSSGTSYVTVDALIRIVEDLSRIH